MANYETTPDLIQAVLENCGELSDGTSEYADNVLKYLNRAQQGMLSGATDLNLNIGEPFPWALQQYNQILTIPTMLQEFPVAATFMSTNITFGQTPPQNLKNWLIQFDGFTEVYRISEHVGTSTSAILDGPFVTQPGDGSANIFLLDFSLGQGILRLANPMITYYAEAAVYNSEPGQIVGVDTAEFARQYPLYMLQQQSPTAFCQTYKTEEMEVFVRFNAAPILNPCRVEYNYVAVPDDLTNDSNSIPVVPRDHRIALVYYASYYLMLDKTDTRTAEYKGLASAAIQACVRAWKHEKITTNPDFGRQVPRPDKVYNFRRLWNWGWF